MLNSLKTIGRMRASGFTLLEVLITLLVISVGLVGMASMQLVSLKASHSSYYRSVVSSIALNVEETLWASMRDLDQPGQCIFSQTDSTDFITAMDNLVSRWTASGPGEVGIPFLSYEFLDVETIAKDRVETESGSIGKWVDRSQVIRLRFEWSEQRFAQEDGTEQFDYELHMPCIPEFVFDEA
ncbi:MAG: type IV pilus modification protein PilV [Wenzhouxiangellaceae bacterium]|nr:type IV pilus modification protein PilV [Wenzhouxiangellaceae bacterium]